MTVGLYSSHLAHLHLYAYPIYIKLNAHFNARIIEISSKIKYAAMCYIAQTFDKQSLIFYDLLTPGTDVGFQTGKDQAGYGQFKDDTNERFNLLLLCKLFLIYV